MGYCYDNDIAYMPTYQMCFSVAGVADTNMMMADRVHFSQQAMYTIAKNLQAMTGDVYSSKFDRMWGETDLAINGLFASDTDDDGVADDWTYTGAAGGATLVPRDDFGNWQTLTKAETTEVKSYFKVHQDLTNTNIAASKYITISCDIITTGLIGERDEINLQAQISNTSQSLIQTANISVSDIDCNVDKLRITRKIELPPLAANIRLIFQLVTYSAASLKVSNVICRLSDD